MADETGKTSTQSNDDVKQSFAWGQLFAGSLLGGLAVWKLLHKMTNTEPSEWFAGLSRAYEEMRDFLMTPFQWIDFHLTNLEKDVWVAAAVVAAAWVRAAHRNAAPRPFLIVFAIGLLLTVVGDALKDMPIRVIVLEELPLFLLILSAVQLLTLLVVGFSGPLWKRSHPNHQFVAEMMLVTLNIAFTVGWGAALLLLNWATS